MCRNSSTLPIISVARARACFDVRRFACASSLVLMFACACTPQEKEVLSVQPLPDVPTPHFDGGPPIGAVEALDAGRPNTLDTSSAEGLDTSSAEGLDASSAEGQEASSAEGQDARPSALDGAAPAPDGIVVRGAEVCDGIDNDDNGIVDDRDVQQDGVCDCLAIATLGRPRLTAGQQNVFGAWLNARSDMGAAALNDAELTPELLRKYEVIVTEDLSVIGRTYTEAEISALEDWVRAGGGLLTLIGYDLPTERTNANAILARFGLAYGADPILIRIGAESIPVTTWLGPHPVIEGVSRIGVDNGYAVLGAGTTLAREGGFDLLKVEQAGNGHLIAFGDEWITYDSEWSGHPEYQVERLWLNMIKWLTTERVCQVPPPLL